MDENLRRQLLQTKRELQITINHIDNVLFYNPPPPPPPQPPRSNSSRQFVEGLMNILSSRRNSTNNESNPNLSRINNLGINSQPNLGNLPSNNISPNNIPTSNIPPNNIPTSNIQTSNIQTSNIPTSNIQTSNIPHNNIPTSNIPTSNIPTVSGNQLNSSSFNRPYIYPNLFSNYTTNPITGTGLLPELVEVTLYSPQFTNTEESMEDVNVSPNINVLSNSSSVHIYSSLNIDFESCTICRENFNPNSIVRKINGCSHVFHINCIDTWFETNITCPICRTDLRDTVSGEEEELT